MPLSTGARIGPYTIGDEIGSGGMGVVYRATDQNLRRDVAIKALPETLAEDAERLARFQREAEVLASLNHPNIAQIYGLERADGSTALVMELVDGPTLEDRIARGPLPADEALGIAIQVADALEAAHSKNIIHRDLKPANIKLRGDGTVKVLDFGIAKALAPENLVSGPQSPIMTTPATQAGVILGTAAYMSPEQAKGKAVDQRTDIWAFGCVLYEMLTGQLAFGAEDVPTTLARVLANDADLDSMPSAISPSVKKTIELCLRKDAGKRMADIRDVRLALEGAFDTGSLNLADLTSSRPLWDRPLPAAAAAVLITGIAVGFGAWVLRPVEDPPPVHRFAYELPADQSFRNPEVGSGFVPNRIMALSPDGQRFVYNTDTGLYLREMGDLEARLIPGTEPELASPTFSPDGQWVAYYDTGAARLERIAISGGAPVVIADFPVLPANLSWETDGTLLFSRPEGIYRVSANGGTPEIVIPAEEGEFLNGPRFLPDGDSVLFSHATTLDSARIVAQSLSSGERKVLVDGGSDARYVPTGHLVYSVGDGLFAVAFDVDTLTQLGGAVPLVQGVLRANYTELGAANFDVANDGTLVYVIGETAAQDRNLVWVDRQGRESLLGAPSRGYFLLRLSPDETKVALDVRDQDAADIWVWDLTREILTRLTSDPALDRFPVWSPDSKRIAFSSSRDGGNAGVTDVFWQAADGTGAVERLLDSPIQNFPTSFVPDGTGVLVYGYGGTAGRTDDDIRLIRVDGDDSTAESLLATEFEERNADVSPDGRWIAYSSNETGRDEIYVRPFPNVDAGGRLQISSGGGIQPTWAQNGDELEVIYRSGSALMAVAVQTEPDLSTGSPEMLFEDRYYGSLSGRAYDVAPDGQRFLMIKQADNASESPRFIVVLNWLTELQRLVPSE